MRIKKQVMTYFQLAMSIFEQTDLKNGCRHNKDWLLYRNEIPVQRHREQCKKANLPGRDTPSFMMCHLVCILTKNLI